MDNQIINLDSQHFLYEDWEKLNNLKVTVKGFEPFQLLPGLTEVSGVVAKVDVSCEAEDASVFITDVDITLADNNRHLDYTIRVRYKDEPDGYDLKTTYYVARLHSVSNQDLPSWASSFEEKERVEEENKRFPDDF